MIRLFVALALPAAIKTQLAMLSGGIPGAKWVPPENYHLTLRFIGEVESWRAEEVETALQRIGLEPERKRFAPHVTLARTDRAAPEKLIAYVQAHNLFRLPPVPVEGFTLYSSRLGKEQAVYAAEVDYALA